MSSTKFKVPYKYSSGGYDADVTRYFFVHQHHTSDITTIYDDDGTIIYMYNDCDNDEAAKVLANILLGKCDPHDKTGGASFCEEGEFPTGK